MGMIIQMANKRILDIVGNGTGTDTFALRSSCTGATNSAFRSATEGAMCYRLPQQENGPIYNLLAGLLEASLACHMCTTERNKRLRLVNYSQED